MRIHPATVMFALVLVCFGTVCLQAHTISGKVTDRQSGAALSGVEILLDHGGGVEVRAVSDSGGSFRFSELPGGTVRITAEKVGYSAAESAGPVMVLPEAGDETRSVFLALRPLCVISGHVVEADGTAAEGVDVILRDFRTRRALMRVPTHLRGEFLLDQIEPGSYLLEARRSIQETTKGAGRGRLVSAPVYFPNATDIAASVPVTLREGRRAGSFEIVFSRSQPHSIRGRVTDVAGLPVPGATVTLRTADGGGPDLMNPAAATATTGSEGRFEFEGVDSGHWAAEVRLLGDRPDRRASHVFRITRYDEDLGDIALLTAFSLRGRVRFDEIPPTGTSACSALRVRLIPSGEQTFQESGGCVLPDGTVLINTVFPGRYMIRVTTALPRQYVGSLELGKQDVLGRDVELAGPSDELSILLSGNAGRLVGRVRSASTGSIVLIPESVKSSRRNLGMISGIPAADGTFVIEDVPPGRYFVVLTSDASVMALEDPVAIEEFRKGGIVVTVEVTVEPRQTAVLNLQP